MRILRCHYYRQVEGLTYTETDICHGVWSKPCIHPARRSSSSTRTSRFLVDVKSNPVNQRIQTPPPCSGFPGSHRMIQTDDGRRYWASVSTVFVGRPPRATHCSARSTMTVAESPAPDDGCSMFVNASQQSVFSLTRA
ncbi:hypothetical protein PAXRUDRAFT_425274 [Paxillus rubicundulus Ve08.2h10]|uniref:Unplaced genomic scaffold scaffold_261, whole genome shotgun sequence n=1 Tax=Paxillus rubicundulus Ve08.2h10 TaxID=930991 RepID=A0A0D0E2H5_9AGAM|nr:hypothetical protein PAXRUDRAFT_425274 [Paxillus rubicundulus Ve08.2h10]